MSNGCVMCGPTRFNFGDYGEGVEMWINKTSTGEHVRPRHLLRGLPVLRCAVGL